MGTYVMLWILGRINPQTLPVAEKEGKRIILQGHFRSQIPQILLLVVPIRLNISRIIPSSSFCEYIFPPKGIKLVGSL